MPPRVSKRLLREQQELAALQEHSPSKPESEEEEEEELKSFIGPKSAFASLDLEEHDDLSEPELVQVETKSKKKKKKKGKSAKTPGKEKDKKEEDDDLDEIDRALKELNIKKQSELSPKTPITSTERLSQEQIFLKTLFSIDSKSLNPDQELKRMFGSKVINSSPTPVRSPYHARLANNPHHALSGRRSTSVLIQPEAGWGSAAGVLTIQPDKSKPNNSRELGDWYVYKHSDHYKESELAFLEVLQQADGNRFFTILQNEPYHVDTLMQLAEMMNQQGDQGASASYLNKALYALSAPLPATFTSGSFRLSYSHVENRAFFVGLFRQISLLTKRGTWRTAFEWCKIALSVGGADDPVGMITIIDFLAPKSKQAKWFLDLEKTLKSVYPYDSYEKYPGLAYARALCMRMIEEEDKVDSYESDAALKNAMLRYPMVVPLMYNIHGGALPVKFASLPRAQVDGAFSDKTSFTISLLSELYVARSAPLWKEPGLWSWFTRSASQVAELLDDLTLDDVVFGQSIYNEGVWGPGLIPYGIIRGAFMADISSINPYLPPRSNAAVAYSFNPIPPTEDEGVTFYNDEYFASVYQSSRRRNQIQGQESRRRLDTNQARVVREGLERLLGLGPEGPAVDLHDELREELLAELNDLVRANGMEQLPGAFPED